MMMKSFSYQFQQYQSEQTTEEHQHLEDQLIYFHQGAGFIGFDHSYNLTCHGEIIWIPAKFNHSFRAFKESSVSIIYTKNRRSHYLKKFARLEPSQLFIQILERLRQKGKPIDQQLLHAFYHILDHEINQLDVIPSTTGRFTGAIDQRLLPILRCLYTAPNIKLSLSQLSQHCGASERTLNRLFQHHFGCSYRSFRQHVVMQKAEQLMLQGETMTVAAYKMGYNNLSAFSTALQQYRSHLSKAV